MLRSTTGRGLALVLAVVLPCARAAEVELTSNEVAEIWGRFAQQDDALNDIARLVRSPRLAIPFLKERLQPVPIPDQKRIARCLANLDSRNFRQREDAARELEALGQLAGPAIEGKLKEKLPLEVRRRLESIQTQLNHGRVSGRDLQCIRGIEVLGLIGSADAIAVLERLSKGAEGAVQTVEARKALADLSR